MRKTFRTLHGQGRAGLMLVAILAAIVGVATSATAQCKLNGVSQIQKIGGKYADGVAGTIHTSDGTGETVPCSMDASTHVRVETWLNGRQAPLTCHSPSTLNIGGACIGLTPGDNGNQAPAAFSYVHPTAEMNDIWCMQSTHSYLANPETFRSADTWSCGNWDVWNNNGDPDEEEDDDQPPDQNTTPIVMPLGNSQAFKLTSVKDGVLFDLNGDGTPEQTAWTAADSNLAFLAIDRDGDGFITSGRELFGGVTVPGKSNGFAALVSLMPQSEEDANQGGPGRIDYRDPIYSKLLLWEDRNHNGISEPSELQPLSNVYVWIGAGYGTHDRKDGHGNQFKFRGWAIMRTAPGANAPKGAGDEKQRQRDIYDVVFVR